MKRIIGIELNFDQGTHQKGQANVHLPAKTQNTQLKLNGSDQRICMCSNGLINVQA